MREANDRDMKEYKKYLAEEEKKTKEKSTSNNSRTRKTTCPACSDKWKQQLPTPKTCNIPQNKVPGFDRNLIKCFLSKSTYMINKLIKNESDRMDQRENQRKMEAIEKKEKEIKERVKSLSRLNISERARRSSYLLKKAKNYSQFYGYKPVESPGVLNKLNLAKIKNQISVKENTRRIHRFLDESISKIGTK